MRQFNQSLAAGQTLELAIIGEYFRLLEVPAPVDVRFYRMGRQVGEAFGMDTGFYIRPAGGFDRVAIESATAQDVRLMVLDGTGGYDHFNVDITSALAALQVDIVGQAEMSVKQGATISDPAAVSVGTAATLIAAASATRKCLRLYNAGAVDVYLGGAGVTTAAGALKIAPGQLWLENDAAPAAWYGIAGTAGQSVRVQEVSA